MEDVKACRECKEILNFSKFKKSKKKNKVYYSKVCQRCLNFRLKNYRNEYYKKRRLEKPGYDKKYKDRYRKSKNGALKIKEYSDANREKIKNISKLWYRNNKTRNRNRGALWRKNNPQAYKILYTKSNKKRQTDPLLNFSMRIRCSVNKSFRKTSSLKRERTFELLGYSNKDLRKHLESFLNKNCIVCNKVLVILENSNIDHIVPVCTASCREDIIRLNQLSNLRLICKECNMDKISDDLKQKELYNV